MEGRTENGTTIKIDVGVLGVSRSVDHENLCYGKQGSFSTKLYCNTFEQAYEE